MVIPSALIKLSSMIKKIEVGEWLYNGCFIQRSEHPQLSGKYEVFKNDKNQTHIGRCDTLIQAKKLCNENKSTDNFLSF